MKDNQSWVIGFFVGLLVVLAVFLVVYLIRGRNKAKPQYDERQMVARNAAYKYAFFSLLGYCAVCGILDILEIKWATLTTLMCIGIIGSAMVFTAICILRDAYEGFNQTRSSSIILLVIVGFINLAVFIVNVIDGVSLFTDGTLNEHIINLCIAVMFFAVTVIQIIKKRMNQKAAEDE